MSSANTRRKTLRSLALTLPAAWFAPTIQVVSLPVHAQTSCLTTDTIMGRSFGCDDSGSSYTRYRFDLEDSCLVRQEITRRNRQLPNTIQIGFFSDDPLISVYVYTYDQNSNHVSQNCQEPAPDRQSEEYSVPMVVSGVPYMATYTLGLAEDPPTVFVSDITIAPV